MTSFLVVPQQRRGSGRQHYCMATLFAEVSLTLLLLLGDGVRAEVVRLRAGPGDALSIGTDIFIRYPLQALHNVVVCLVATPDCSGAIDFCASMPGGKRTRALVCCFCGFEARTRNGLVLHQKAIHKKQGGNGIPPSKRPCLPLPAGRGGPSGPSGDSHQPAATFIGLGGAGSGEVGASGAAGAAGGVSPAPVPVVGGVGGDGSGQVDVPGAYSLPDESEGYDGAIRDELYALMALTGNGAEGNQEVRIGGGDGVHPRDYDYQSLSTRVRNLYEVLDDAACSVPLLERRKYSRPGQFNTRRLRALQQFVLGIGGAGMSRREQKLLYAFLCTWDDHEGECPMVASEDFSLREVFPSVTSFMNALRDDLDEAALDAGWMKVRIKEGGVEYEAYYRPVLKTVLKLLRTSKCFATWSGNDVPAGPTDRRATPLDGDALRLCEKDVIEAHGVHAFVLGLHLYSDASQLSWSGGMFGLLAVPWRPCVCLFVSAGSCALYCSTAQPMLT